MILGRASAFGQHEPFFLLYRLRFVVGFSHVRISVEPVLLLVGLYTFVVLGQLMWSVSMLPLDGLLFRLCLLSALRVS